MARPGQYDPDQWEQMNTPDGQARIRDRLARYLKAFLDSAPEGGDVSRVIEVLSMLRWYFNRELRIAEEGPERDPERASTAETILIALANTDRLISKMERAEKMEPETNTTEPPWSDEQLDKKLEEWQKVEDRLRREGKEHWWE